MVGGEGRTRIGLKFTADPFSRKGDQQTRQRNDLHACRLDHAHCGKLWKVDCC